MQRLRGAYIPLWSRNSFRTRNHDSPIQSWTHKSPVGREKILSIWNFSIPSSARRIYYFYSYGIPRQIPKMRIACDRRIYEDTIHLPSPSIAAHSADDTVYSLVFSMHYRELVSPIVFIGTQWRTLRLLNKRINVFVRHSQGVTHEPYQRIRRAASNRPLDRMPSASNANAERRLPRMQCAHSNRSRLEIKTVYTFRRNIYSCQSFCSFRRGARVSIQFYSSIKTRISCPLPSKRKGISFDRVNRKRSDTHIQFVKNERIPFDKCFHGKSE